MPITFNTDGMVSIKIDDAIFGKLFDSMDKASFMSVKVGNGKPINVSLAGSTKAMNAFRTCAHIRGNEAIPGANPFK